MFTLIRGGNHFYDMKYLQLYPLITVSLNDTLTFLSGYTVCLYLIVCASVCECMPSLRLVNRNEVHVLLKIQ